MYWKLVKWGGTALVVLVVIAGVFMTRRGDDGTAVEPAVPGEQAAPVAPGAPAPSTQKFNF